MSSRKSKRQLRAEAVERLREYHDWEPSQKSLANVTLPLWPMSTCMSNDQRIDALIDLLQDDEPPYDKLLRCLENDHGIKAKWDGLRKVWAVERAEPPVNNLTWLYGNEPAFRGNVNDLAAQYSGRRFSPYQWDEDAREWLMAEHAEFVLNAEKYNFEPESGAESCTGGADVTECSDAQASDLGFVPERQLEPDTREELEADVRNYSDSGWLITVDKTFDWLDRQADITERECIARQNGKDPDYIRIVKELDAECAELQAKVDALEVENDEMARKLGTLLCTLTNGKFSHVEHPVEFMLSKVREEQEAELDDLTERIERM